MTVGYLFIIFILTFSQEQKEKFDTELENLNSALTQQIVFSKSSSGEVTDQVMELTEIIQASEANKKVIQEKYKELFKRLNNQVNDLKDKFGVEIDEKMEIKLQNYREKQKADDNDLW